MKLDMLDHVIRLSWMLLMMVWLALASESNEPIEVKRDKRSDVAGWIVSLGWVVLLLNRFNGPQLLPRLMSIRVIGSVLTITGLAFALWARFSLGSNWDSLISLRLNHKLVRTGPYAIVRHPIYSRFMIALAGSFLNFGHLRSLIAVAMVTIAWVYKAGLEETFMRDHFGIEHDQYCHDVKRLIPKIW